MDLNSLLGKAEELSHLNIFTHLDRDWLEHHCEAQSGVQGPLSGKAVAVKDNINVRGLAQSCGSAFLRSYVSLYDATVVEKLRSAGAILFGKTNMDEFAMGSSNEYSDFGPVLNPVDPKRVPGGSSGGSAAAVSSGIVDYALGSDTGGSIRQPAAFNGIVGLKPSYGRVSRYGLTAFASSFDQIGTLTRTVRQSAELLQVIAGRDERDSTSADLPVPDYLSQIEEFDPKGKRIAVPFHIFENGLHSSVEQSLHRSLDLLRNAGASIVDVQLPRLKYAIAAYYILATAEASSNLARFDGIRYGRREKTATRDLQTFYADNRETGFGEEVKRRIMLGTYVLSSGYYDAYYQKAQKLRRLIYEDYAELFRSHDAVLFPTTPTPAFLLGELRDDPIQMYLNDIFTVSANIAGIPALSLPGPVEADALPVGIQISAKVFDEGTLLSMGHWMEQEIRNQR